MPVINYNNNVPNRSLHSLYSTPTFADVFPEESIFENEYKDSQLYDSENTITKISLLYYLLYARYGNWPIASYDVNRFKYAVYATIFQYGPAWEAKLKTQTMLRGLLEDEDALLSGAIGIQNHSNNPSTPPSNDAFEALPTIDDQNASKWTKGKLEGYSQLMEVLKNDCTEAFIDRFKPLFSLFGVPDYPPLYAITKEEQEILKI